MLTTELAANAANYVAPLQATSNFQSSNLACSIPKNKLLARTVSSFSKPNFFKYLASAQKP